MLLLTACTPKPRGTYINDFSLGKLKFSGNKVTYILDESDTQKGKFKLEEGGVLEITWDNGGVYRLVYDSKEDEISWMGILKFKKH